MKILFKHIAIFFLVFDSVCVLSQIAQTKRLEIELKDEYEGQQAFLFYKNGLVLYSKRIEPASKIVVLKFENFNTDLQKISEKEIATENQNARYFYTDSSTLWVMHYDYTSGDFELLAYNVENQSVRKNYGSILKKVKNFSFIVENDIVYFSGEAKKEPYIATYKLISEHLEKITMEGLSKKALVYDVTKVDNPCQIHLQIKNKVSKKEIEYLLVPFDVSGKQISKPILIEGDKEHILSSFSTSSLQSGNYIAAGTYSNKSGDLAQGIYITSFGTYSNEFKKYYNFLDFNNFTSYLSEKGQNRILKKQKKKENSGQELSLDYTMVVHDIKEHKGNYIFVGEVYYATYRTERYTTYINGMATTQTRRVFDGYQYTHAVVASFDKLGNIIWSNTFNMWLSYKPFHVKKFISVGIKDDKVSLLFANGSQIKSISFINGEIAEKREVDYIQTGNEQDVLKWTSGSEIEHWYENNFISTGFQKIKNKSEKIGEKRRRVYFINKVEY